MPKYVNHDIITKLIEDTDWYHINSNGELVLGATSDTALYKASDILTIIRDVSTTDVAPVVHGKWVFMDSYADHETPVYACSVCYEQVYDKHIKAHKYCLHCGAKMDKEN